MPKINGKNIDPKVYAKRVTQAKKTVANMDPAVKAKIKEMYPNVTKESITKKALSPKKAAPKATATPKVTIKPKSKGPGVLKGEAAAEAVRKSTTPKGVKKFEKGASKALDKKYPGLYKKSK